MLRATLLQRPATYRTGGAAYQVLAFLTVASLGAWLGAGYVGVDVQHLAYTALDEARVIERIPEAWRPTPPPGELGDGEGQVSFEQRAAELIHELKELRGEVAAIRQDLNENDPAADRITPNSFSKAPPVRRQATLAYWTRLRQIAAEVTELHDAVEPALTSDTAAEVFGLRRRAFDYGARAILSVDFTDVDQQAIDAGYRIGKIYESGADLYARASDAWEGRVDQTLSQTIEKSLEHARQQHSREVDLLRQQTSRTEVILMRRYAVEFPELSI